MPCLLKAVRQLHKPGLNLMSVAAENTRYVTKRSDDQHQGAMETCLEWEREGSTPDSPTSTECCVMGRELCAVLTASEDFESN